MIPTTPELKELCRFWYCDQPQKQALWWNILRETRSREVGFLGRSRMHRSYSLGTMKFLIGQLYKRFGEPETEDVYWHFYRSIELVKQVVNGKPLKLPGEWIRWGFDYCIDIDSKKETVPLAVKESKKEAQKIFDLFNKYNAKYTIKFSGRKGLHFIVPWKELTPYFKPDDYPLIPRKLTEFVIEKADLNPEFIDMGLYGIKKLFKTAYSIHPDTGLIALPLSKKQFENFDPDMTTPKNVLKNSIRDMPVINPEGNFKNLYEAFIKEKKEELSGHELGKEKERQKKVEAINNIMDSFQTLDKEEKAELLNRLKEKK